MLKFILLLVSIGFGSLIYAQNNEKPESPYKAFFNQLDSLNDFEKSNFYLIKELKRNQTMESDDLLKFHEKIAINYIQCLKMDSAFLYLNEGLLIAQKLNNEKKMAQFHNVKGGAYYYLGQMDQAIVEYEKSIELARKLNAKVQLASVLSNLGGIYIDLKKEEKAETLLNECVFLFDSLGLGNSSNNIIANRLLGTLYFNRGETEKSLVIFTRLVEISKEIQNVDTQISAQVYMARALNKLGKKEEARVLYLELI
jgi:tetratricopeptide (TPR) repeat protein